MYMIKLYASFLNSSVDPIPICGSLLHNWSEWKTDFVIFLAHESGAATPKSPNFHDDLWIFTWFPSPELSCKSFEIEGIQ